MNQTATGFSNGPRNAGLSSSMQQLTTLQNRASPLDKEIVNRLLTRYHPNMMRVNLTATNLREGNDTIDPDEKRNKEI